MIRRVWQGKYHGVQIISPTFFVHRIFRKKYTATWGRWQYLRGQRLTQGQKCSSPTTWYAAGLLINNISQNPENFTSGVFSKTEGARSLRQSPTQNLTCSGLVLTEFKSLQIAADLKGYLERVSFKLTVRCIKCRNESINLTISDNGHDWNICRNICLCMLLCMYGANQTNNILAVTANWEIMKLPLPAERDPLCNVAEILHVQRNLHKQMFLFARAREK